MDKHIWLWWRRHDVTTEREQMTDEGRDASVFASDFTAMAELDDDTQEFQDCFNALLDRIQQQPVADTCGEPSDLAGIHAARPGGASAVRPVGPDFEDRLHGAWLGRCAGCLLGKPLEGWRSDRLWGILADAEQAMLTDYLWRMDIARDVFEKHEGVNVLDFGRAIHCMPEDDDTNYTTAALALVKQKGLTFTPDDVATFWMGNLPILHTCTAERVAYRNVVSGIWPPDSASHRNPYREWIGAQIRADLFGYVAPGNPSLAAELAWRDASISHVRNGIYGEMWVAAMLAAAAVETDIRTIIDIGLSEIPATCRLAADIARVLGWHAAGLSYLDAVARIHEQWDESVGHHWCHTNSNAQIVALGLLYGDGDFERTVCSAVYPCFDTDCNGATAGSVIGMVLGAEAIPAKWSDIMCDTLITGVAGYHTVSIAALAKETLALARIS